MIVREQLSEYKERVYSDLNLKIKEIETGIICDQVVHSLPCYFTYEETDKPVGEADE